MLFAYYLHFIYQLPILFVNILVTLWFVFLDMDSNTLDSQGCFKWKWTPIEDLKLVEALVEYPHESEGNPRNKIKPRYLKVLVERISTILPNARLRAKPNIE